MLCAWFPERPDILMITWSAPTIFCRWENRLLRFVTLRSMQFLCIVERYRRSCSHTPIQNILYINILQLTTLFVNKYVSYERPSTVNKKSSLYKDEPFVQTTPFIYS